jgi:hypothetical protein
MLTTCMVVGRLWYTTWLPRLLSAHPSQVVLLLGLHSVEAGGLCSGEEVTAATDGGISHRHQPAC